MWRKAYNITGRHKKLSSLNMEEMPMLYRLTFAFNIIRITLLVRRCLTKEF